MASQALERALKLAAITGLRAAMGPALVATSQNRPERQALAMLAMGEMVLDKIPFVPSRATLPLMLPRALAGAWVAQQVLKDAGEEEPWAAPLGAAVAAGVAVLAPRVRGLLSGVLGIPSPLVGLAEDYLAIRCGSEAVGLTMDDMKQIASDSFEEVQGQVRPTLQSLGVS